MVEAMGGHIWIDSSAGVGTTVSFTAVFQLMPAELEVPPPPNYNDLHNLRVLVIDDSPTSRAILVDLLSRWGMMADSAASGQQGIAELALATERNQPYQLILLDENMPHDHGFDVLELMQHDSRFSCAAVMMLRVGNQVASIAHCRKLGLSAYVIKPFRPSELVAAIRVCLGAAAAAPPPPTALPVFEHPLHILVAEDNVINQKLASALLNKLGHEVTLANNGQEAIDLWSKNPYDLILMDVQMPEMDGTEATIRIRALEAQTGQHIPIIALTANAMSGDRVRYLDAGMDDYITKPIVFKRLELAIASFCAPAKSDSTDPQPAESAAIRRL
jgi:CheY-like chemotaxis protein